MPEAQSNLASELRSRGFVPFNERDTTAGTTPESTGEDVGAELRNRGFVPFEAPKSPSVLDVLGSTAQGVATGGASDLPAIAGGTAGFLLGAATGPAAPIAAPVLGVGGFIAGTIFGEEITEALSPLGITLTDDQIDELSKTERVGFEGGRTFISNMAFASTPFGPAMTGQRFASTGSGILSRAGRFADRIIDFAARSPGRYAFFETTASIGSGVAGAAAQAQFPDEPLPRLGFEVVGGYFGSLPVMRFVVDRAASTVATAINWFRPAAKQTAKGKALVRAIQAAGGDPEALAQIVIRQEEFADVSTTAAMKAGDRALADVEAEVRRLDKSFDARATRMAADSLEAIKKLIVGLRGMGDPAALKAAAQLEKDIFTADIQSRLNVGLQEAVDAASQVLPTGVTHADIVATKADMSVKAKDALTRAVKATRDVSSKFWNDVPGEIGSEYGETLKAYSKARGELISSRSLPREIEEEIANINFARETIAAAEAGEAVHPEALKAAREIFTIGEQRKLRSNLLELAREAEKPSDARRYGEMAQAVLEDMGQTFKNAEGISTSARQAYDRARNFEFRFNEIYTRTFAGATRETGKRGQLTIQPEVLLRTAFATGDELRSLRLRDLREATRFLPDRTDMFDLPEEALAVALEATGDMIDAQAQYLRLSAASSIDPQTGRVDPKKLQKFINDSSDILDSLPESTRKHLEEALKSEQGLRGLEDLANAQQSAAKTEAFAKILKVENPFDAVSGMLRGDTPAADLREAMSIAQKAAADPKIGASAVQGLRATVFDVAIEEARGTTGEVSLKVLANALTRPVRAGQPSVVQLMVEGGVLDRPVADQIVGAINRAAQIAAGHGVATGEAVLDAPDIMVNLLLRTAGSSAGAAMGGLTGRADSLIAMSAGSQALQKVFQKIPLAKQANIVRDALAGAPLHPGGEPFSLLAEMLKKHAGPDEAFAGAMQMHAYAYQAGYTYAQEDELLERGFRSTQEKFINRMNTFGRPATELTPGAVEQSFSYTPILNLIAKGESGVASYNAMNQGTRGGKIVGSGSSQKVIGRKLTDMTIGEVMEAQSKRDIFAAGRYQIIPETMKQAVRGTGISTSEPFSPEVQDQLAIYLITQKRPEIQAYLSGDGSEQEALLALAKEFASFPDPNTGRSYYGSGNKASISLRQARRALNAVKT